jgi:2-oxoisovalerate dehydrogenase E1 component beta subunit
MIFLLFRCVIFREDVKFGAVLRCSIGLNEKFGTNRVGNAPFIKKNLKNSKSGKKAQK